MPLFEIPNRTTSKAQDKKIVSKTKSTRVSVPTIKGGNDILSRINQIKAVVEKNLGQYKEEYQLIRDQEVLHDFITECIGNSYIAIDTETDGLDPLVNILAGICPYTHNQKSAYIPINHISYITGVKASNQLSSDFILDEFKRLLVKKPYIDMFNAKFDIRFLRAFGLTDIYCNWDGYLASRILNENEPHKNLKQLHNKYCLDGKGDAFRFDDLFKGIPFTYVPPDIGYLYAAHDPIITYELCEYQRKYLTDKTDRQDIKDMYWVFKNIEMPCINVVADMEDNGILFDKEYAKELSVKYTALLEDKEKEFYKCCDEFKEQIEAFKSKSWTVYSDEDISQPVGKRSNENLLDDPINIASPKQLAILLYDILKLESPDKKAPRGTGEEILSKFDMPLTNSILEYREVSKLLSTYIDKLPECVNPKDGRIHCSFNQYGADTGRFSSQDPNLQNIPSHNKDIRKMFIASPGYVLMSSDYSQQEPKVMTQMCQDPKMIQAYKEGKDLYAEIAALSFNTTYENCLEFKPDGTTNPDGKNRRSQAKSILLGVLYGRGVPSIAEQLYGTPKNDKEKKAFTKKAQIIKDSVFKGFPAIPKFEEDSLEMGRELGYVTTLWGRKRRLPDLQLPTYEFMWKDGAPPDDDLLDFDFMNAPEYNTNEIPEDIIDYYWDKLDRAYFKEKQKIKEEALREGIEIKFNDLKIADAQRQCVNARIQGSAADMSKLAMILVGNDKRLKELGFRLLIPVHDELIAECPEENAKECSERFAKLMSEAAKSKLEIPIKCDVEITRAWYGERVEV